MRKLISILFIIAGTQSLFAQSSWEVVADKIDANNYYGVTLANGVVGIVSSPEPLKVKDVVLNGAYDYYQRGRVSNILKTFNHVNMNLDIDGARLGAKDIQYYKQVLDMKNASLITTFDVGNKAKATSSMMSLRHLPYTALTIIEIKTLKDITITPMSLIEAPNHLMDVRNYYAEIDRQNTSFWVFVVSKSSPIFATQSHTKLTTYANSNRNLGLRP